VICCEWVVDSFAFATYPAGNSVVSDLFCSFAVVALIVQAFWFWVLLIPKFLAEFASCFIGG